MVLNIGRVFETIFDMLCEGFVVRLRSCRAVERRVVIAVRSQWCDSRIYISPTRLRRASLTDYLFAAQYARITSSHSLKTGLKPIY